MKFAKIAISIATSIALLLLFTSCNSQRQGHETRQGSGEHAARGDRKVVAKKQKELYRCPMHPQYTSDRPGTCPICGMTLVKVEPKQAASGKHKKAAASENMPPGLAMVSLGEGKRQLIGIQTVEARRERLVKTVRASAVVRPDERKVEQVQSKIQGWVERRFVNFTGQFVKRGQALLTIYSPDLVSTQEEYLLALRNLKSLEGAEPYIREGAESLVKAARRRLRYWDVSKSQIKRLERTGRPFKTITLFSPVKGYVLHMNAIEGMEVKPGMPLYTVADLSRVWVMADVHERDIGWVENGMKAVFMVDALPGRELEGKVAYINPDFNPVTRTVMVRVELPNPDLELRPQMHGDIIFEADRGEALVVPPSAVMDNGDVKVVFVETKPGHYMPRGVKIGIRTTKQVEILGGVEEGERVVVNGNFLLDSESRLKASVVGAAGGHQH